MEPEEVKNLLAQYKKAYGKVPEWAETVSQIMPELLEPWLKIRSLVIADRVLPRKTKELILLGINLVRRYPSGMETHLRGAMDAGATKEEIMEVVATAILSSAAPAISKGGTALRAELERRKK